MPTTCRSRQIDMVVDEPSTLCDLVLASWWRGWSPAACPRQRTTVALEEWEV